ncbi:SRPBCC family protein [Alteromonas sp. ASW11-36]|uniref:SRPBCC family protein n=1 Tax=Alteromonas arenosi TaxID=3055817 RepID=A0ABT7SWE3_9ALTE|nr:SRPBCC family protein [Alteromonas sp. ASW11-36]MDM7860511.1 SRPBCC family protein [Alteromonas sp. ASW11-36]
MFDIKVERLVKKPIEEVFAALADHGNYAKFPGVDESELITQGEHEANGKGALRRIKIKPFTLYERIVAFERPNRLQYQIEQSSPITFEHEIGEVRLTEAEEGTRVVWISRGHLKVPILGSLILDPMTQKQGAAGFASILKAIERQ